MKRVVLITGASSGIGLATAKQLLQEGYIVYAGVRSEESFKIIEELGGFPVRIEMEDENTMVAAVDKIIQEQGRIDVLFNNAGWGHYGPIEEVSIDIGRKNMEINLFGLARLTQLVIPHMRKAGKGTIVNTSSIGGKVYIPLGAWYHASKHALEGWSDCLRFEMEPLGIKVIIIEPGIIDTGFNEEMIGRMADLKSVGAYDELKNAFLAANEEGAGGSQPEVIARVVSKALKAKKPKTRYHAGEMAALILFVRRYFSDRFYDWFMRGMVRQRLKRATNGPAKRS